MRRKQQTLAEVNQKSIQLQHKAFVYHAEFLLVLLLVNVELVKATTHIVASRHLKQKVTF